MAYITKHNSGWRAQVNTNGVRKSQVFATKSAASQWAAAVETEARELQHGGLPRKTLLQACDKYLAEVTKDKGGAKFERLRIEALLRDYPKMAGKIVSEVTTDDWAAWRDARLKTVQPATVLRELRVWHHLFKLAREEWKWVKDDPFVGLRMPKSPPPRDRLPTPQENMMILRWLGYRTGQRPQTKMQEVALAYLLALRTGMRAGEVLQLGDDTVNLDKRVATVKHKTQRQTGRPRQVPLSRHAVRLLRPQLGRGPIFTVDSASLDALFRRAKQNLGIEGLHFHDSRADALTRFAQRVDVMTLAKISGHRDLRILMNTYYRETPEQIAAKL